jgi:hypothetical protein
MKNLYLCVGMGYLAVSRGASGLLQFQQLDGPDVSTGLCGLHYVRPAKTPFRAPAK